MKKMGGVRTPPENRFSRKNQKSEGISNLRVYSRKNRKILRFILTKPVLM